ncbi:MAG TPA: NAD(P)H-hydrate dehydratase [Solirubrobacteraceae bacterium]|jgi:NAD(P)H-hydrate epimerase|nr:NAD(P)H-hydrate dehydratase [Solirubrobacteraceae bacterium]
MQALPDWLAPLPDAEGMRAVDRWAIDERGVPGLELMERAGAAVVRAVERISADGPVTILCGKGNNGGDGLVVARLLRDSSRSVTVVCVSAPSELAGDARANLERLPGAAPVRLDGTPWSEDPGSPGSAPGLPGLDGDGAVAVDALLGTGFAGEPHGEVARAIELLAQLDAPIVSVDVPSGVDASTGVVAGQAVSADATVTFHAGKPGLWIAPGKARAGTVHTADIGIPRGAPLGATVGLISPRVVEALPRREANWTKFRSGQVVVAGGSRGLSGAPALAARASMRAGAGYVIACVPASQQPVLASSGTPEMMTRALAEDEGAGTLAEGAAEAVLAAVERGGSLALGPGLGRSDGAFALARRVAREARIPLVLDADALNAHAGRLEELVDRPAPAVLTPHAGEMGRLLDRGSEEVERERLRSAREAAQRSGCVVVLKGDDTLVADPAGRVAVSGAGTPALATAGSGDVLTGVIAALLAQGLDAFTAAAAGVWLHAQAGREAARKLGVVEGVIASDVIDALPRARAAWAGDGTAAGTET